MYISQQAMNCLHEERVKTLQEINRPIHVSKRWSFIKNLWMRNNVTVAIQDTVATTNTILSTQELAALNS